MILSTYFLIVRLIVGIDAKACNQVKIRVNMFQNDNILFPSVPTVNRVGADPVKINDTCIGVFGGIQPELLPAFARGKVQSGFMDTFDETPKVVPLSAHAKALFKEWYDKLADQKNNGSLAFAGMTMKMEPYCGRLALGLELARGIGMGERTFKRWLQTNAFKKISYGFYEKRFR